MTPEYQVQELYQRCIELEGIRYDLQNKIQNILDYLVHSHITVEEMKKVQEILERESE
jgi:hypothetical protein